MTGARARSETGRRLMSLLVFVSLCAVGRALMLLHAAPASDLVTLSIVATTDLHGVALPRNGLGGLPLLAGYVNNLRAARAADRGAVLLLDSGDTFQGDSESDLSEGAFIVDAYNAMGYAAEAIGNHDFDFGSVDSPTAHQLPGDLRGALKARAAQARYPFLTANLIDDSTGRLVEWPNVRASVMLDVAGVKVGVVGVMTIDALRSTLDANVRGLHVAPLASAIAAEATRLRAAGAALVVVASHAGGRCERFADPQDLSSCDSDSEIFRVARSLPRGLVDVIAAGHTHGALAQRVEGISIIQAFSRGQAFGRADVVFDRSTKSVVRVQIFAPQTICAQQDPSSGMCVPATAAGIAARYEGKDVVADPAVVQAMTPGLQRVHDLQAARLGVSLDQPILRGGDFGSALGDIFADAIRAATPAADVAVLNNATRGLWADLPAGPITFGRLYDVFPFDNRIAHVTLTGAELSQWLAGEIKQGRESGLGISGAAVRTACTADAVHVDLVRPSGQLIHDGDQLLVATIASPTLSGNAAFLAPQRKVEPAGSTAVVREVVEDWFRRGRVMPGQFDRIGPGRADGAAAQRGGCAF